MKIIYEDEEDVDVENDPFCTSQIEGLMNDVQTRDFIDNENNFYRICSSLFPAHSKLITLGLPYYITNYSWFHLLHY